MCIIERVVLAFMLLSSVANGQSYTATCIGVIDGDTIDVMHNNVRERIRIFGIDAPEKEQDYGRIAKQQLSATILGKDLTISAISKDRLGQIHGNVEFQSHSLNESIVAAGLAWWDRPSAPGDKKFKEIEAKAKAERRGLWRARNPTPPWEYKSGKADKKNSIDPKPGPLATPVSARSFKPGAFSVSSQSEGIRRSERNGNLLRDTVAKVKVEEMVTPIPKSVNPSMLGSGSESKSTDQCPQGGNHVPGVVDVNGGGTHCAKCGRYMSIS